jgi:hypothetical protein
MSTLERHQPLAELGEAYEAAACPDAKNTDRHYSIRRSVLKFEKVAGARRRLTDDGRKDEISVSASPEVRRYNLAEAAGEYDEQRAL